MTYLVGESLVGDGNEVAHIDLIVGEKEGPVGQAFASALSHPTAGHIALLAMPAPNLMAKPATILIPKVDIKNLDQAVLMFGPAQAAVGKAVGDSVQEGVIPKNKAEDLCILCGVFIHPQAADKKKIYEYNYEAAKQAIKRAFKKEPSVDEFISRKDQVSHPYKGF